MNNCSDRKLKYRCNRVNARCVFYEGYIPEYSDLINEDCVTIEETTEDLYTNQEIIKESIDLSQLGNNCIDYSEFQDDPTVLKVKEALLTLEQEICNIHNNSIENCDSTCFNVDNINLKCLENSDPCNVEVLDINSLFQTIINKICELNNRITTLESI